MKFGRIAIIQSELEAQMLKDELDKRDIPHVIKSYHDSALDGLFQASHGWGEIDAAEEHKDEILKLVDDLKAAYEQDNNGSDSE